MSILFRITIPLLGLRPATGVVYEATHTIPNESALDLVSDEFLSVLAAPEMKDDAISLATKPNVCDPGRVSGGLVPALTFVDFRNTISVGQ